MNEIFVKEIQLRSPFRLKRIPPLARFHRAATRRRKSRKAQLLLQAPLEKTFQWYYRMGAPATGELEFETPHGCRTITFNARNLAFDMFYVDLWAENYEDETAVLMDTFLPRNGCLYDIGSNWGYFSLYAASRGGDIKVHSFEPIPSTYADLVRCIEQAGLSDRIQCHNYAASDSCGHTIFQVPIHSAGAQIGNDVVGRKMKIETRTVDSMGFEAPDFMKIDAEGHEAAVLRGSMATIQKSKPFIMFENKIYRDRPHETLQPLLLLQQCGYRIFLPTLRRDCQGMTYFVNCGYQIDTAQMQQIKRQDTLALVPCAPSMRFLFTNYLNVFACHQDRMSELQREFTSI